MFKKSRYIALAIVAVVALVLLNLPANTSARLRLAISSQFLPLFGLANKSQDVAGSTAEFALSKRELIRQNDQLRRDIAQLKISADQTEALTRENARLTQMLGWQQRQPWRMKLGRVVLRDPANWWRTVQIDLGRRNGLSNNLAVLSPEGFLIGRVSSVSLTKSQVVLIGDPNCKVPALVENDARNQGVIVGGGPLDDSFVKLTHLAISRINVGENAIKHIFGLERKI